MTAVAYHNLNYKSDPHHIYPDGGSYPPLPATKIATFSQPFYDEAKKDVWFVINMKNDWKVIFPFELSK
jgi:hypothetical protein